VYSFLKERGAAAVLSDPRMAVATAEVVAAGRTRSEVQAELARKEAARKALARAYQSNDCSADDVLNAIYSFSDNNTYLLFNRDPVERMLQYLRELFQPRHVEEGFSLAISTGARAPTRLPGRRIGIRKRNTKRNTKRRGGSLSPQRAATRACNKR
jgi:Protein of unknown function (DUF2009)